MEYKKGDIVELLNFNVDGNEGYHLNCSGLIPTVGHRYHVYSGGEESVLLLGKGEYGGLPKTFLAYASQISIYKPKRNI